MSLTKADIANSISDHRGFSIGRSLEGAESILDTIKETLESGEDVLIKGLFYSLF